MQHIFWNDRSLSRLMLGTVQLGLPYGVGNRTGQPSQQEAVRIIAAACEAGVNCFDTAAAYGTSEQVLGDAIRELRIADHVTVVTKIRPLSVEELADEISAERAIRRSIDESRQRLHLDCLPVVLFHRQDDARYLPILLRLRDEGLLRSAGVSCDNYPDGALRFSDLNNIHALQIPANVLDRRHISSGVISRCSGRGIAVFVRSVFLQGLLTMPVSEIPDSLTDVIPARRLLTRLAEDSGLTLPELAVRYILSLEGVTCLVVGMETTEQITQNAHLFARGPLSPDLCEAVSQLAISLPEKVVTPQMWQPENRGLSAGSPSSFSK